MGALRGSDALACRRVGRRPSAELIAAVLETAHLITAVRLGREKLHYLNPVPIHEATAGSAATTAVGGPRSPT